MEGLKSQILQRVHTEKLEIPNEVTNHSIYYYHVKHALKPKFDILKKIHNEVIP